MATKFKVGQIVYANTPSTASFRVVSADEDTVFAVLGTDKAFTNSPKASHFFPAAEVYESYAEAKAAAGGKATF